MVKRDLLLCVGLLTVALVGLACARVVPPAEPQAGLAPTPVLGPPPAAHPLAADEECLACHRGEERFLVSLKTAHPVPVPPGHAGTVGQACMLCHAEQGHSAAGPLPHPLQGYEACLACHASGAAGVPAPPPNHRGYSGSGCTLCHAPPASATTPGPAAPPGGAQGVAPPVPHQVAGHGDCLACHGAGLPGISGVPAGHTAYANNMCVLCHAATPSSAFAPR